MRQCPPLPLRKVSLSIPWLLSAVAAHAQVVTYEGAGYPEADSGAPWTEISQNGPMQRWIDNGLFCQLISPGQLDAYNRSISEFTGVPSFFLTWREITDSPRSVMSHTPNVVVVASSVTSVLFHFRVTTDRVELLRGDAGGGGSIFDVDIQPGVLHTYYLALHGDLSYVWYIDGAVANSGQYPSTFPDGSSAIQWGARCFTTDPPQNAKWDFVRYGVIPADHGGDFNNNGVVDETDVYFFVDCLLGPGYDAAGPGCRWADMNADGKTDGADIQLIVAAMTGA